MASTPQDHGMLDAELVVYADLTDAERERIFTERRLAYHTRRALQREAEQSRELARRLHPSVPPPRPELPQPTRRRLPL